MFEVNSGKLIMVSSTLHKSMGKKQESAEVFLKACKNQVNLFQIRICEDATHHMLEWILKSIQELSTVKNISVDRKFLDDFKDGQKLQRILNKRIIKKEAIEALPIAVAQVKYFEKIW